MKYVSIDIETTGVNSKVHQTLQVSLIIDDLDSRLDFECLPKLDILIKHEKFVGEPFAMNMNKDLIKRIDQASAQGSSISKFLEQVKNSRQTYELEVESSNINSLHSQAPIEICIEPQQLNCYMNLYFAEMFGHGHRPTAAGKNLGTFDFKFLDALDCEGMFAARVLDVGSLYAKEGSWKDKQGNLKLPNLTQCLRYAKVKEEDAKVTHDGLDDAWCVIKCVRHKL